MKIAPRITSLPGVCGGRPCVEGTRLEISIILEYLENGFTFNEIEEEYPFLSHDDISATIRYARLNIEKEEIFPFEMAP